MNPTRKQTAYCEAHTNLPLETLQELERETHLKTLSPQMLSGKLQGQLLAMLSMLAKPKLALEIGTFTGYATICLAKGLAAGGVLHTIEVNPEVGHISRKYFEKSGLSDSIRQHLGDANAVIPTIEGQFDLVFIDGAKFDYAKHYELVIDRVTAGGIIIADNVLWGGKVVAGEQDADTRAMDAFNKKLYADFRVETLLLPLRDGLLLARKC